MTLTCMLRGANVHGVGGVGPGGCLLRGEGGLVPGGARLRPPRRLLLRVVRILLECILVHPINVQKIMGFTENYGILLKSYKFPVNYVHIII